MKRLTTRLSKSIASWNYPDYCYSENEAMNKLFRSVHKRNACERLAAIEDILGDDYELDRLRELVELYNNVPHICDYCIGCEIEPTDGHGCDGYDNFVFSVRRIVAALKARE